MKFLRNTHFPKYNIFLHQNAETSSGNDVIETTESIEISSEDLALDEQIAHIAQDFDEKSNTFSAAELPATLSDSEQTGNISNNSESEKTSVETLSQKLKDYAEGLEANAEISQEVRTRLRSHITTIEGIRNTVVLEGDTALKEKLNIQLQEALQAIRLLCPKGFRVQGIGNDNILHGPIRFVKNAKVETQKLSTEQDLNLQVSEQANIVVPFAIKEDFDKFSADHTAYEKDPKQIARITEVALDALDIAENLKNFLKLLINMSPITQIPSFFLKRKNKNFSSPLPRGK